MDAKLAAHIKATRRPVPLQHPQTVAAGRVEEASRFEDLQRVLETPRDIPPYTVPKDEVVTSQVIYRDEEPPMPVVVKEPRKGRQNSYVVRYKKYRAKLAEFHETRNATRVAKLQRVVRAGLATEHAYYKELTRLKLDQSQYPLPFRPNAYLSNDSGRTIKSFLEARTESALSAGTPLHGTLFNTIEGLICSDTAAREQWVQIQEKVNLLIRNFSRAEGGFAASQSLQNVKYPTLAGFLQDSMYFENIQNILAERSTFYMAYGADPLAPNTVAVVNASLHAKLLRAFLKSEPNSVPSHTDLFPVLKTAEGVLSTADLEWNAQAVPDPSSAEFTTLLEMRSKRFFWRKCAEVKKRKGEEEEEEGEEEIKEKEMTRRDWIAAQEGVWEKTQAEVCISQGGS